MPYPHKFSGDTTNHIFVEQTRIKCQEQKKINEDLQNAV